MWSKKRHKVVIEILRPIFKVFFRLKYKLKFGKAIKIDDGALIVSNHVTTLDPFMISSLFKNHIYHMSTIDLFEHAFLGKLIKFLVNPIPKEKGKKSDLKAIKTCIKVAKEGKSICIFAEGNRTFDGRLCHVDESIGKLALLLKKPLIICNIEGGYASDPRWCNKTRKGKMNVSIKKIYQYDEIKDMSAQEITSLIINGINVDNYNFYNRYVSKKRAEYLERIFYICPICGAKHHLVSNKHILKCTSCNNEFIFNEDLNITSSNKAFKFNKIYDWYDFQINDMKAIEYVDDEVIYQEEDVVLAYSRLYKSKVKLGKGNLLAYNDRFVLDLKDKKEEFKFDEIEAVTVLGKKKLGIYARGKTYQVFGSKRINVLKYMHLFYYLKNKKEGKGSTFLGI